MRSSKREISRRLLSTYITKTLAPSRRLQPPSWLRAAPSLAFHSHTPGPRASTPCPWRAAKAGWICLCPLHRCMRCEVRLRITTVLHLHPNPSHDCPHCSGSHSPLVSFAEGAELIGVNPARLDKWFRRGQAGDIPEPIRIGKARYFRSASILRWLNGPNEAMDHCSQPDLGPHYPPPAPVVSPIKRRGRPRNGQPAFT